MKSVFIICFLCSNLLLSEDQSLNPVVSLYEPVIDGKYDSAWYEASEITVRRISFRENIQIRSLIYDDSIYFFVRWRDADWNKSHKPWEWNSVKQEFVVGKEREDSLVFRWPMSKSSNDIWSWGSVRTNQGFLDDRYEIISKKRMPRSYLKSDFEGNEYYLQSLGDSGRRCWRQDLNSSTFWLERRRRKYFRYMPIKPEGSRADVLAAGSWEHGTWTFELKRKLVTGFRDDVEFRWSQVYLFDIVKKVDEHAHLLRNDNDSARWKGSREGQALALQMPDMPEVSSDLERKPSLKNKSIDETNPVKGSEGVKGHLRDKN